MRFPRGEGLGPVAVALAAAASSLFLFSHTPAVHAQCGTASSPCPTPTPVNAFLSIDPTTGDPNTVINVSGGQFLPNESMSLYWDQQSHVAGSAQADANGNVNTVRVKPFAGDSPGVHHLCASVLPNPCANFSLQALPVTPPPSPTPPESPSPTPTPIATGTPIAPPPAGTINGFDVITRPPFVFLPIAGLVALALAFGFWLMSYLRRPRQPATLPTAAVVHRAMRPDYSAGFGAPPPAARPPAEPSAWDAPAARPPAPPAPAPPAEESPASEVEWGEPVEWGTGSGDWGFPEPPAQPEDLPEPPQPGD